MVYVRLYHISHV